MITEVVQPWSQDVVDAALRFDQGHLVERPPIAWATRPDRAVTRVAEMLTDEAAPGEELVIELDEADRPPYGIITSQGCDVADTVTKPWVQVAPVYPADRLEGGAARLADARANRVPHLVVLEPPSLDRTYVADLRIEVPLEKSMLVERDPIDAFATDEERRVFALRLAGRLERPALPDDAHRVIVRPLRKILDRMNLRMREILADAGIEFRLAVTVGTDRIICRLLVIARTGEMPETVKAQFDSLWDHVRETADPSVVVLPFEFATSDDVTMREYLTSVLLDDRFLEPAS